jgi:hypothetical protein
MSRALSKALELFSLNPDISAKILCDMLDISERTAYRAKARYKELMKDDKHFPHGYQEPCKALVFGDLHVPKANMRAVDVALGYGEEQNIDTIIINGDLLESNTLSRHPKNPMESTFAHDVETARQFLKNLRDRFPDCKIFFMNSNHEDTRLMRYLQNKAPELFDLEALSFPNLLGLADLDIHYIDNTERISTGMAPFSIGKISIDHGDQLGVKSAVNTARAIYLKCGTSVLCSHFHRTESKIFRRFDGTLVRVCCVGCLTTIFPSYISGVSNHNLGFAIVKTYANGFYDIQNLLILDSFGEYKVLNA